MQSNKKCYFKKTGIHLRSSGFRITSAFNGQNYLRMIIKTEQKAKITEELKSITLQKNDTFDKLMRKFDLWKCIRVIAWINRFITY